MPIKYVCGICKCNTADSWLGVKINGRNNVHITVEGNVAGDKDNILCQDCLIKSITEGYIE